MRLKLLLVALLIALPAQAAQAAQIVRGPDRIQYSLDLDYSEPHVLRGTQTIRFHNPFATPMSKVWLRLWANYQRSQTG